MTAPYYLAEIATAVDMEVLVSHSDFEVSLHNLVPSVSQSDMEHYSTIQKQFNQHLDGS